MDSLLPIEAGQPLPPALGYWRDLGAQYVSGLCTLGAGRTPDDELGVPVLEDAAAWSLVASAPMMAGAEVLTTERLQTMWGELDAAFRVAFRAEKIPLEEFLHRRNPAWNVVGRVHFHLAENRKDETAPFAFMATYTTRLSSHGKPQHTPLGQALKECT